jgi:NAD+ kinase
MEKKKLWVAYWEDLAESKKRFMAELFYANGIDRVGDVQEADAILSVGGDGSMLRASNFALMWGKPMMGYNTGHLGFLTCGGELNDMLKDWNNGKLVVEERSLLEIYVNGQGYGLAINEIAFLSSKPGKLVEVPLTINDDYVTTYSGDGLVVSTPTGSTAYNMSAGGPIATPDANIFCITPIAPFSLSNRPIVVGDDAKLEVRYEELVDQVMVVDGWKTVRFDISQGPDQDNWVTMYKSNQTLKIMHADKSFYNSIRKKLGWANQIKS